MVKRHREQPRENDNEIDYKCTIVRMFIKLDQTLWTRNIEAYIFGQVEHKFDENDINICV